MRDIVVTPQFQKDLKDIPDNIKEQADTLLNLLQANPVSPNLGIKKLHLNPPAWRARIGVHRLVYSFTQTQLILHRFRHRKDVYRNL